MIAASTSCYLLHDELDGGLLAARPLGLFRLLGLQERLCVVGEVALLHHVVQRIGALKEEA